MDLIDFDSVAAEYGEAIARRLARHTVHADWQGRPVWEAERLDDLLALHDLGE